MKDKTGLKALRSWLKSGYAEKEFFHTSQCSPSLPGQHDLSSVVLGNFHLFVHVEQQLV